MKSRWIPKSISSLEGYSAVSFASDLIAGVTVGLVALPLAMAFSISSGLSPQAGLYCAVVTGFLISLFGGSRFQIGGPTGAFVAVVAGIVAVHGIDGLFMCTMMAGVILIVLGVTGMGAAVTYIPRPVVVGFTNGIAVVIASTQIRDFFGIQLTTVPGAFWPRITELAAHARTFSPEATTVASLALVSVLVWNRLVPRVPGYIVVLLVGTVAAAVLDLPIETIGSRFGGIPHGWPPLVVPKFRVGLIPVLASPALTIAILGAVESLMSAVVADRLGGDRHNPNMELIAQGIANVASPLFGGLPATGAIARTATSIRSGARTPIAGMIHAVTLLVIVLAAAPLVRFIPLAILASILFVVAYRMGDWAEIPELLKLTPMDIAVWLATFALTVFADLTIAMEVGMILAMLLFIRKVSLTTTVTLVTSDYVESGLAHSLQGKNIPAFVSVFRIHGPFLFGGSEKIRTIMESVDTLAPVVILRLRNMTAIDATGLRALEDLADDLHRADRSLILCGAPEQPAALMRQAEFHEHVGAENICPNIEAALKRAAMVYQGAASRASG